MTDDIRALKAKRRKHEVIWRKNPLFVNFEIFQKSFIAVKYAIDENKTQTIHKRITDSNGDQKNLSNIIKTLLGRQKKFVLPEFLTFTLILQIMSHKVSFNIHVDSSNNESQSFLDILNANGLIQHVKSSTHQKGHILDLVITREQTRIC